MDLHSLQCFVALAEELHFRRAAVRMHITQPAMSQQLRQLEEQLSVKLVYRNRRQVSLTRAGEMFLQETRKTLQQAEQAVVLARRTDHGEIGQLFVGVTQTSLFICLPEIVRSFREALPEIGVVIKEMTTAEQESALRAGEIQVGLVHPPLEERGLVYRPIVQIGFDVVMANCNPLAKLERLTLNDLAREPFIMFPRRFAPWVYDGIISLCAEAGFSPKIAVETSPAQSIIAYAAANLGIGLIASKMQQAVRPGVVYRRLSGNVPQLTLGVAFHPGETSPAVRAFVAVAESLVRSTPSGSVRSGCRATMDGDRRTRVL